MSKSSFPDKGPVLRPFTCIGHWARCADEPEVYHVNAVDGAAAIKAGEQEARKHAGLCAKPSDTFFNTFVLRGHCEVLSSWAG